MMEREIKESRTSTNDGLHWVLTPDLSLGTVALWVEDVAAHEPINCQSVPIRELEISVGPRGDIDTRFVVRHTKFRYLPALLPDVEMPAEIARKAKASPQAHCRVEWGFWRDWTRQDDVVWKSVVRVAGKVVAESKLEGEGSCPLIVARFNPDSMYAFGKGSRDPGAAGAEDARRNRDPDDGKRRWADPSRVRLCR